MSGFKILCAAVLLAATSISAQAADKVTIRIAYANHSAFYQEIAEQFMQSNPDIGVELLPAANDYDTLLQTLLRSNITNDLPDVAFQSVNRIDVLSEKKMAAPLDDFIKAEKDWNAAGYTQSLVETCEFNGATYCLPFAISVPVIYYNPDLVKEAGGDPDHFPKTWDEIIELAKKIDALSPETLGIYFSYYNHSSNWTTTALIDSQGGRLLSPDGTKIAFDSAQGMWMLELMRRFGEAGQLDISLDQARQAFAAGTLGILSTSSSHLATLEKQSAGQFKLRTASWPVLADEGRLPAGGNGIFMTTHDAAKQEAAWKFIKFATGPIGQTIMVKGSGYTPVNTLALDDPNLLGGYFAEHPDQRAAADAASRITRWEAFPGENGVKASDIFRDHVRSVATLGRLPADVMPDMVRDVSELMPKISN